MSIAPTPRQADSADVTHRPAANRNFAARAYRKTVLQRCFEINEELKRESALKRQLYASIILDGVIEP